ncbi:MAG: amidohydrolase, partial [Clostridiales bacterium]|nr:amidohydrolase [Clostridiales bacterium]
TVIYYGCPGEEGAGSKQFMGRAGIFDEADFILTWHPANVNGVDYQPCNAILGANFYFKGISAHAGGSPHLGRSALDAAELMSVGVNYLREHMIDKARIHYAYSDVGGTAPNVVQDRATVKYEVRSPKVAQTKELFQRVVKVAQGAAMMTETQVTYELTMGFSDYSPNMALAKVVQEVFNQIGAPKWNQKEYDLAKAYLESYDKNILSNMKENLVQQYGKEKAQALIQKPLSDEVEQFDPLKIEISGGSTDVGDVGYIVPTIQIRVATNCIGNVGHTWQTVGQSCSDAGKKGMMTAVQVLALSAIRLLQDPATITQAKEEVALRSGGSYICPLPDEVAPPIGIY